MAVQELPREGYHNVVLKEDEDWAFLELLSKEWDCSIPKVIKKMSKHFRNHKRGVNG